MRQARRRALLKVWIACGSLACPSAAAGCGNAPVQDPARTSRETADAPARLPPNWHRVRDARIGFTLALPPGWSSKQEATTTRASSPDRRLALSVSADRGSDGKTDPPDAYVRQTVANLEGYRGLRVGPLRVLKGLRYPAATITATGVFAATGVRQQIQLFALRRPGLVTYVIAVFRNASVSASRYAAPLETIVRSFRAQPPRG